MNQADANNQLAEVKEILASIDDNIRKPSSWGKTTNSPYYRKAYAIWLRPLLDRLKDNTNIEVKLDPRKFNLTRKSLWLRIIQAWLYLIDRMDTPDEIYLKLRNKVQVKQEGSYVTIRWKLRHTLAARGLDKDAEFIPRMEDTGKIRNWRDTIFKFIDDSNEGDTLALDSVALTKEDQAWIFNTIYDLDGFAVIELADTYFKIVRSEPLSIRWKKENS